MMYWQKHSRPRTRCNSPVIQTAPWIIIWQSMDSAGTYIHAAAGVLPAGQGDQHCSSGHHCGSVKALDRGGKRPHMDQAHHTCSKRAVPGPGEAGQPIAYPTEGTFSHTSDQCISRDLHSPETGQLSPLVCQWSSALKARSSRVAAAATAKGRIDGQGIQFSGIQILICGTKWDAIEAMDGTSKEILARALRCVAHAYGCHLLYHGASAGTGLGQAGRAVSEQACSKKLRHLLTHMMFIGLEKKL